MTYRLALTGEQHQVAHVQHIDGLELRPAEWHRWRIGVASGDVAALTSASQSPYPLRFRVTPAPPQQSAHHEVSLICFSTEFPERGELSGRKAAGNKTCGT